jgi:transposase
MPYKWEKDKIKMPIEKDRRIKIRKEEHKDIRDLYLSGTISYQKIADMYCVSKSLIIQIVNPDIAMKKRKQFLERRKDGRYYSKEKHTNAIREHRQYKKRVLKSN